VIPNRKQTKVTENNTENNMEIITENNTEIITEKDTETITELKKQIKSKRPTSKTKQTISIDKIKYNKLKKYCNKNGISFQSLMVKLIDVFLD
jgi:hypothetical protein